MKMYNFMQVVVLLKNAVLWLPLFEWDPIFRRELSRKNELWHNVSAMAVGLTGKLTLQVVGLNSN